ncbi:MAG: FtsX-like permease family protein [Caldilineaceae bacterium]
MLSLRWRYAARDLWLHKTRTLLVILSIAVGVFAFGMIFGAIIRLNRDLPVKYRAIEPASAIIHTTPFDQEMIDAVRRMPEVAHAEGRFRTVLRFLQRNGEWHDLEVLVLEDYTTNVINRVLPYGGAWPPPDHALLVERNSLFLTQAAVGESILLEMPDGKQRTIPIAGLTHDMNQPPAQITGVPYTYATCDTLEWLGYPCRYNQLQLIVAQGREDQAHITRVAQAAAKKFEDSGYTVLWTEVPIPGHFFAQDFLPTIQLILGLLGTMALVLSSFLVINVITAILTQQTRQIGVMKAIGAQSGQITNLYLRMVFAFGVCALVLAVPLGATAAYFFARFVALQLNFDLDGVQLSPGVLGLQVLVGLLAPILAALAPIAHTAGMTVLHAIQDQGLGQSRNGQDVTNTIGGALQQRLRLSRPVRLSLRNTFRRRGRLVRTLVPLGLGGAIFMTVLTLRLSLFTTLEETISAQGFDVQLQFDQPVRISRIAPVIEAIPAITAAETWTVREGIPIRSDGSEADSVRLFALPPTTQLYTPEIIAGRWLQPDDQNAMVVAVGLIYAEPTLKLGDDLTIRVDGVENTWRIVGITEAFQPPVAPALVYVNQRYFWQKMGYHNQTDTLRALTALHDPATHAHVAQLLLDRLNAIGVTVRSTRTASEDRRIFTERFNIITSILMIMAFLLATVGSLGLMGTMSINVLERKREIGVMRAIGASNHAILQIFIVEGVIIGLISWVIGLLFSPLISYLMSRRIGMVFTKQPLTYIYDPRGPLFWLLIVILVAALASLAPARNAANLSVRETLAYE